MDRELRRRVIAFLERHVGPTAAEREAALSNALHGCGVIPQVGHMDEPASTFTGHLVDTLWKYGRCAADAEPSLVVLIRYIGSQKGVDVQTMADALCDDLLRADERLLSQPALAAPVPASGYMIARRYKLLTPLGDESGQATVWRAQDTHDPEVPPVAIKCMKPHPTRDYASRFTEEVRSLRELEEHPHIMPIYDYGIDRGLRWLVMPVMGESLRALLDRTGRLAPQEAMQYLDQIAGALDFAHRYGIIHRDLKPANVLFTRQTGHLRLADFGIAYRIHRDHPVTGTGETAATEEYAAPEQLRSTGVITAKVDIYALAIIAYELLVGERPFKGSKAEIAAQHLREDLPLPEHPQVTPYVLEALRCGAAKDPAHRPETASALVTLLRDALAGKAPSVIDHYLSQILPAHLQEVMPKAVFAAVQKAFVNPSGEVSQEPVIVPPETGLDPDLFDDEFLHHTEPSGPEPLSIELSGELYAPRERRGDAVVEYTPNVRERIQSLQRVVLLGEPGAGKTFMLARLALDSAEAYRRDPSHPLLVFVPLSRYDTAEPFQAFVSRRLGMIGERLPQLNVIWLLDALNEMPREKQQWPHLKTFIDDLVAANIPFVLSCRVKNYDTELAHVPDLHRIDLQDLNPRQILDILTHHLTPTYAEHLWRTVMTGEGLLEAWAAWEGGVRAFWERPESTWDDDDQKRRHLRTRAQIHRDPRKLLLLGRNPFTLVRLLVPRMREAVRDCQNDTNRLNRLLEKLLPNNRAQLFGQVIEDMLRAEARRQAWTDETTRQIIAALEFAAPVLQASEQRTEMLFDDLLKAKDAPEGLIDHLKMGRDAGLITLTESAVRFNHQLYQEYFATQRLRDLLDDYTRRHPDWQTGAALPPRDERLAELFPQWWNAGGWVVTVALLGELEGRTGIHRVVRWLASYTPEFAVNMVRDNNDGLTLNDLNETARQALVAGAQAQMIEADPRGRAAAYRVLGLLEGDERRGIGTVIRNGVSLPDIEWVTIPAGEFIYQDQKKLSLPAFAISRYPITYAQFQAFIDDDKTGFRDVRWWEGLTLPEGHNSAPADQAFKYGNYPRERVSWYDAVAFCRWLSWWLGGGYELEKIGEWVVRLPTEQEWEKAARGSTGWEYPYGDKFDAAKGNTWETGIGQTSAVGIFPEGDTSHWEKPISDLSGNVWEWCLTDYESPKLRAEDENLCSGVSRVLRGGSWYDLQDDARAASRVNDRPNVRDVSVGFRVVCRPPSPGL